MTRRCHTWRDDRVKWDEFVGDEEGLQAGVHASWRVHHNDGARDKTIRAAAVITTVSCTLTRILCIF